MILQHACHGDLSFSKNASLCLSVLGRGSCFSTGSWLEGIVCRNKRILSFAGTGGGIKNLSGTDRVHPHLQSINQSSFHFIECFLSTSCFLHSSGSRTGRQNAGFGLSRKLKTKKYFMCATLHMISLSLILYQTQQMFKGKRNRNSHKIIFIISGRQAIYSSEITERSTRIHCFTLFAWPVASGTASSGNPIIRMASACLQ